MMTIQKANEEIQKAYEEELHQMARTLGRLDAIIDRWDVPKQNPVVQEMIAELRQVLAK